MQSLQTSTPRLILAHGASSAPQSAHEKGPKCSAIKIKSPGQKKKWRQHDSPMTAEALMSRTLKARLRRSVACHPPTKSPASFQKYLRLRRFHEKLPGERQSGKQNIDVPATRNVTNWPIRRGWGPTAETPWGPWALSSSPTCAPARAEDRCSPAPPPHCNNIQCVDELSAARRENLRTRKICFFAWRSAS